MRSHREPYHHPRVSTCDGPSLPEVSRWRTIIELVKPLIMRVTWSSPST